LDDDGDARLEVVARVAVARVLYSEDDDGANGRSSPHNETQEHVQPCLPPRVLVVCTQSLSVTRSHKKPVHTHRVGLDGVLVDNVDGGKGKCA